MPALQAPSLQFVRQTASGVTLTWTDPNPSDKGFDIQRQVNTQAREIVASVGRNTTGWTDTALPAPGASTITLTYRVRARAQQSQVSPWSNAVTASIAPAPAPPTALAVPVLRQPTQTATTVTLLWADPNAGLAGTQIERTVAAGTPVFVATVAPGVQSWMDTALPTTPSTSVSYRVRAVQASLVSGWSTMATIITPAQTTPPPLPPAGCSVTLADGNQSTVQAAVSAAVDGDVICIPAGTWGWSDTNAWSVLANAGKSFTLRGAGKTLTHIQDLKPSGNGLIFVTTPDYFRLTGIHFFQPITGGHINGPCYLQVKGPATRVRVDHCHFDKLYNVGGNVTLAHFDDAMGVMDNCTITYGPVIGGGQNGDVFINTLAPSFFDASRDQGHGSWDAATSFGSSNFMFYEDLFYDTSGTDINPHCHDCEKGGRFVVRHSLITNGGIATHGSETGAYRGCRAVEVYNSTFQGDGPGLSMVLRAGTGVFHDNTGNSATKFGVALNVYRRTDDLGGYGFCDGSGVTGKWDRIGTLQDSGTHTGANDSITLVDSTKSWSPAGNYPATGCLNGGTGKWGACKYSVKGIHTTVSPAVTLTPTALTGSSKKFVASSSIFKARDFGYAMVVTGGASAGAQAFITSIGWKPTATVTPAAITGSNIQFDTSVNVFIATDVGKELIVTGGASNGAHATIVTVDSATRVHADITVDFANTSAVASQSWKMLRSPLDDTVLATIRYQDFANLSAVAAGDWNIQWGTEIYSNDATHIKYEETSSQGTREFQFDTGHRYEIWGPFDATGAACLDYSGSGQSTVSLDGIGAAMTPQQWPGNGFEPVYSWGNTVNGVTNNHCGMTDGTQFYPSCATEGIAMPGYVPYTYPHPLRTTGPTADP